MSEPIQEKTSSGLSTASLVLGIIGIVLSIIPIVNNIAFVVGIFAAVFGLVCIIRKKDKGKSWAGLILGILAIVLTLAMQASAAKALDEASNNLGKLTGEKTEEIMQTELNVEFGPFEVEESEYGLTKTKVVATVTNTSDTEKSYMIQVEAVNPDGSRILDDNIMAQNLKPGQSQEFETFTYISDDKIEAMKSASFAVVQASSY